MQIKSHPTYPHIVATSDGTIYNTITWNKLNWWYDTHWYRVVDISWRTIPVHRLVCETYHWLSLLTVNHKDWNKRNNHFTNLEWLSLRENNNHALVTWLNKCRPIRALRIGTNHIIEFSSIADATRELKIDKSAIIHCLNWRYKQWKWWRFEDL